MTIPRKYRLVLAAALLIAWTGTAAAGGAAKKIATVEGITEYQLENGLRILLFPDDSKPKVTINITILVGSRHEGYGETGMAHLLEHMVFKGTPKNPKIDQLMQARGAVFNGSTWVDRTNYYETLTATDDNVDFAIALEADRLVNSYIKREDLVSEMTVVRNEFEQGENSPVRILMQRMLAAAYEWHNYGKSTIGNRSDIERVPIEKLQAFYKKYYQPDNAVLVVAGKFDEKKALQSIEKHFGAIPRPKRPLDNTYTDEPAQDGERVVTLRRVGDGGFVGAMYHIPAGAHPDFAALTVLTKILDTEPSGRLYEALVKTKKAAAIQAAAFAWHDPGMLMLLAQVPAGSPLEPVRDIMLDVTEKVAEKGVTAEEVERATRKLLAEREQSASQTTSVGISLSEWAAQGDWRLYFLHRDRLEKVTPADVKRVAGKYLLRANRTVGMFVPMEKPERVAVDPTPDYLKELKAYKGRDNIAAGEAFETTPANIFARTKIGALPDGIKTAVLPKKTRGETVNLQLTLRYGDENSLQGYVLAAQLLPQLMLRGTAQHSFQQFRDELDKLKAKITAAGSAGVLVFRVEAKRSTLPAALELLREVLREPLLPAEEMELFRRLVLSGLDQQKKDPRTLASLAVQRLVSPYPKGDVRYVSTIEEDIEATKGLTIEQVKKLYADFIGAEHGELAIVGDFDADAIAQPLGKMLGGWKAKMPYARMTQKMKEGMKGQRVSIETPDKENANYYASLYLSMNDEDADYPALVLANEILGGGGLAARLGDRIRQKEGWSYGIGSGFSAGKLYKVASFTISGISNPLNMPKVEKAVLEEIELLRKTGVTQEELDRARHGFLQQLKVLFTSDAGLAGTLGTLLNLDRTINYYAELEKKLKAVTPAQLQEAFARHIDGGNFVVGVAGDFAKKGAAGAGAGGSGTPK